MPYIAGTGVPTAVTITCPRCKALRLMLSTGPELTYTCTGCEWPMTFAAGTGGLTTNTVTTTASTALGFASGGTAFSLGQVLFISDGGNSEIVVVNGTPTGTSVPVADFDFGHGSGVSVTVAVAAPTLSNQEKIPNAGGYGF